MLGCMIESELGIAPAAQIASLFDWVDLDGHLLLADRPFAGLGLRDGRVLPADAPGLGVEPVAARGGQSSPGGTSAAPGNGRP
jgi:L-alanine-DL-glutamate epimerase-like enolase superfamily enzyme